MCPVNSQTPIVCCSSVVPSIRCCNEFTLRSFQRISTERILTNSFSLSLSLFPLSFPFLGNAICAQTKKNLLISPTYIFRYTYRDIFDISDAISRWVNVGFERSFVQEVGCRGTFQYLYGYFRLKMARWVEVPLNLRVFGESLVG